MLMEKAAQIISDEDDNSDLEKYDQGTHVVWLDHVRCVKVNKDELQLLTR